MAEMRRRRLESLGMLEADLVRQPREEGEEEEEAGGEKEAEQVGGEMDQFEGHELESVH